MWNVRSQPKWLKLLLILFIAVVIVTITIVLYAQQDKTGGIQYSTQNPLKRTQRIKEWNFKLGTDTLGYKGTPYPRFGGIILNGELVYFIDPVLARLNSLNLTNGTVCLGKSMSLSIDSKRAEEIDNIIYFSNHLFAITYGGLFIVDLNLSNRRYDTFPDLAGRITCIHRVTDDSLVLSGYWWKFVDTIHLAQNTYQVFITYDNKLTYTIKTYQSTTLETNAISQDDQFHKARGKPYRRFQKENEDWIDIGTVILEIPPEYSKPKIVNWDNMDFDEKHLVFWDIDENEKIYKIIVFYYELVDD